MTELVSGFLCCDLESNDQKDGYKLSFNGGRLLMALIYLGIGAVAGVFLMP